MSTSFAEHLLYAAAIQRIKSLEQTCEDKDRYAEALERRIGRRDRTLDNLRGELKRKSSEIHDLRGELKRFKDSVVWLDPAQVSVAVSDDCQITGVKTAADRNRELLKAAVDLTAEDPPRSAIPPNHECMHCGKKFPSGWIPGHNVSCPDCGSVWPHVVGIPVYRSVGI